MITSSIQILPHHALQLLQLFPQIQTEQYALHSITKLIRICNTLQLNQVGMQNREGASANSLAKPICRTVQLKNHAFYDKSMKFGTGRVNDILKNYQILGNCEFSTWRLWPSVHLMNRYVSVLLGGEVSWVAELVLGLVIASSYIFLLEDIATDLSSCTLYLLTCEHARKCSKAIKR